MKRTVIVAALVLGALAGPAFAEVRTVRVGWCAKTISSAAAPFAIATKLGWFEKAGIKVELVPLPGSTDCVKSRRKCWYKIGSRMGKVSCACGPPLKRF